MRDLGNDIAVNEPVTGDSEAPATPKRSHVDRPGPVGKPVGLPDVVSATHRRDHATMGRGRSIARSVRAFTVCRAPTGTTFAAVSTFEHRPADLVAQPLIVQDELADCIRELFALPTALEPSGAVSLACGSRRTRCLDRVGRSTELVCSDMRHHRGLAGSECCVTSRSAQHSCRSHGMAARRAGLGHPDLASRPCPNLCDRLTGPGVQRLHRLEEVQNVPCAPGRPQSEEPMVGVRECAPAADGDEPGVALLRQGHGPTVRR